MADYTQQDIQNPCVTLIGMAGAGKTTVGHALAKRLGWAHLDTDHLIEAYYGRPLQDVFDALGREQFIVAEEDIVSQLNAKHCVISTGGSVIYGPRAIAHLGDLGPLVYLEPGLDAVRNRIADPSGRGLAIARGQSIDDLYAERKPLYESAAHLVVDSGANSPEDCAKHIAAWLAQQGLDT